MIRVLVAEDSPTSLELITQILAGDGELTVVGAARDGAAAVEMTKELRPDVVIMDVHMPVMDGFEATRRIMVDAPTPIVIVSASIDVHEVAVSMHALRLGALTLLGKPAGPLSPDYDESAESFRSTIKAMAKVKVVRRWSSSKPPPPTLAPRVSAPIRVVAIGASTGGPAALYRILTELPASFAVPILAVQHIASGFVEGLASWLSAAAPVRVKVGRHLERMEPGTVYLAPDDHHLGLVDAATIELSQKPPLGGFRPSASYLFESTARAHGPRCLALILTGMGQDGLEGLRAVRRAGGRIIAQDEESSVVFGMPGAAVADGLADMTLSLDFVAGRLKRLVEEQGR